MFVLERYPCCVYDLYYFCSKSTPAPYEKTFSAHNFKLTAQANVAAVHRNCLHDTQNPPQSALFYIAFVVSWKCELPGFNACKLAGIQPLWQRSLISPCWTFVVRVDLARGESCNYMGASAEMRTGIGTAWCLMNAADAAPGIAR